MARGVLFDMDGTLVDSVDAHARAWQRAFESFGRPLPYDEVRRLIGKGTDQLLPGMFPPDELARIQDALARKKAEIFAADYLAHVEGFPGVRALFEKLLRHGWKIAIASSAGDEELAEPKRIAGIADLIDEETSKDDADRSKPHPDIFEAALDKLGLLPESTLVVGDSPYDAEAARRLKLKTVGVLCGGFPAHALTEAGCIAIFEDPQDLLTRFDESPFAAREESS